MKFLSQINVNTEYTLPIVDGNNGQVLTTDGSGAVYWGSVSMGAINLDGLTDVIITSPQVDQILAYTIPLGESLPAWRNITSPYATKASPAFTGIPTAPTAPTATNTTQIATTAFVKAQGYATTAALANYVPYDGATTDVDLGEYALLSRNIVVSHASGSGVAASITKGGNGEALTVVKSSGTGNAASITGGVTLLTTLHLTNRLEDSYINSAANWNAAYNDSIRSATFNTADGVLTLVQQDLGTVTVDLDGRYLTTFVEDDPIFTASAAYGITSTNISNWNAAYNDKIASAAVTGTTTKTLTLTQQDGGTVTATWTDYDTNDQELSWDLASQILTISGGNSVDLRDLATQDFVTSQGYLTSYTETDPTVPAHVKSITTTQKTNWDTAFGWGNHATVGYLTSITAHTHAASDITSGTFSVDRLPKQDLGVSIQGNFGQWQGHSTYTNLNTDVEYWGWNFVQGNTNAPHGGSEQWYRGRFSLGDAYGLGTNPGDYWMEIAIPRYNQGSDSGNLFVRTCENGSINGWQGVRAAFATTTAQTDFSSLTVEGETVATKAWVQAQNYLTSETDSQNLEWDSASKNLTITNGNTVTLDGLLTNEDLAAYGYITGESDTLATVTSRGASTTGGIVINGDATIQNSGYLRLIAGSSQISGFTVFNAAQNGYLSNRITTSDHARGWGWEFTTNEANNDAGAVYFRVGYNGAVSYLNSGNFGIGTTDPSNKLTVYQGGGVRVTGIASGSYIEISGDLPGYASNSYPVIKSAGTIHFANNGKYSAYIEGNNTYFGILDYSTTTRVFLNTAGNSYLTGGNLGIGTTAPQHGLHINLNQNQVAGFQSPNPNTWIDLISTAGTWSMGATSGNTWAIYERGGANATRFEVSSSAAFISGEKVATQDWVSGQGYITGYTETDTLATVTGRGATTSSKVFFTHHTNSDPLSAVEINGGGTHTGLYINPAASAQAHVRFGTNGTLKWQIRAPFQDSVDTALKFYSWVSGADKFQFEHSGNAIFNGGNVWTSANDGSGSGLDADLLDGVQLDNVVWGNARGTNDSVTSDADGLDKTGYYTSSGFTTRPSGVSNWMYIEHIKLYNSNTGYQKQIGYDTYDDRMWVRTKNNGTWSSWKQIWTSGEFANNSANWNTAYGWGNHADAPYWNVELTDGIGVAASSVRFAGDVRIDLNLEVLGTITESSSIRYKENIQPLEPALAKVEQLNPVTYTKIATQEEEIGLIAEEVAELFPEVVTYNEEGQPDGISYSRLSVILLKAMQEQNAVIAALTERVNKLENK